MTKVLLVSPFFFPEPISTGKYNTYLAQALTGESFSVDVWCSHPVYPSWVVERSDQSLPGMNIKRGGLWLKYPKAVLLRRAVLEGWYFFYCLFRLLTSRTKFDVVVAIFPPSLFMLLTPLLRLRAKYFVGVVHDLQGVHLGGNSSKLKSMVASAIHWVESFSFRACDKVIYLSRGMEALANASYGVEQGKSVVQYPFVTIDQFVDKGALQDLIPSEHKSVVYSGALGDKQNPDGLLSLMIAFLNANPDFNGYIFSQGPIFERLNYSNMHERLSFQPLVAESDLPELLVRSTIQIVPQATGTSDGSLPSKLPNLLASNVGIFCITDDGSELIDILADYDRSEVSITWDESVNMAKLIQLSDRLDHCSDQYKHMSMFTREGLVNEILKGVTR